jgi:Ca2+-binding EF-hand superfamily protein
MHNVSELLQDSKKLYLVTKELFEAVDTDGSGKISEIELWGVICSLADDFGYKRPSKDETVEIMQIVDIDKSGVIEFPEFRKLIKKIFKAVYEDYNLYLEEKRKKDIELEKLDM